MADQRKINVGLLYLGRGMTTMIVIVFSIALALLLAYFIKESVQSGGSAMASPTLL